MHCILMIMYHAAIPFDFVNLPDPFIEEEGDVATICVAVIGILDRIVILELQTLGITAIINGIYNTIVATQPLHHQLTIQVCMHMYHFRGLGISKFRFDLHS